jgi:hypothetical protein
MNAHYGKKVVKMADRPKFPPILAVSPPQIQVLGEFSAETQPLHMEFSAHRSAHPSLS